MIRCFHVRLSGTPASAIDPSPMMSEVGGLSQRMSYTVAALLLKVSATIAERKFSTPCNIDLATAENWLIRPELVNLCKDAVAQSLEVDVSSIFPPFFQLKTRVYPSS